MAKNNNIITLDDVARAANVSKSTVSRVLSGNPRISQDTRKRVERAAKRLNYQPNQIFSVMASRKRDGRKKSNLLPIAHLYDNERPGGKFIVDNMARDFGFSVETYMTHGMNLEKLLDTLYNQGVCGIVVGATASDSSLYAQDYSRFSVVVRSPTYTGQTYHSVGGHVFGNVLLAYEEAVKHGYTRIGAAVLKHPVLIHDDEQRQAAIMLAQKTYGPLASDVPPFLGDMGDMDGMMAWYHHWQPDAIIGFQAHQLWRLVNDGVRVPEDVGFISLHCSPPPAPVSGILTTDEMVSNAILSLMDQLVRKRIRGIPEYPMRILIPAKWYEGETVTKRKPSMDK